MVKRQGGYGFEQPEVDASYGLVYRLNYLWSVVDQKAPKGDYDGWNNFLDRIYCNLLFKEEIEAPTNEEKTKVLDVGLSNKDKQIYVMLNLKIKAARMQERNAKTRQELQQAREKHYHALMLKDVWLRKFMQKLGLYLRVITKNPARALFGGG